jgi:superfamily II DNA helicase RecQ
MKAISFPAKQNRPAVPTNQVSGLGDSSSRQAPTSSDGTVLRSVLDFPEPLSSIFERVFPFDTFNRVQTAVVDKALSDETLVVLAPTGAGKTVFFELAICRELPILESRIFSAP